MDAEVSPLSIDEIQWLGGSLRWERTEIALCNISILAEVDDYVRVGDIFETTECPEAGLQDAFDRYGLPETACLFVQKSGVVREFCTPLDVIL